MTNQANTNASNPLSHVSTLKNRATPFHLIKPEHFLPAIDEGIIEAKANIERLKNNPEAPTFANTVAALEACSERVDWVAGIFFNLLNAESNDQLQALAAEIAPRMANLSSDIILDAKIFSRLQSVWSNRNRENLTPEQNKLLENTFTDFVRNGAKLTDTQKLELREIDQRLSKLSPEFSDNILKDVNAYEYWVSDRSGLSGLPESAVEAAAQAAKEKGKPNQWLFTLHGPSVIAFLEYSDDRAAREKLWRAYNSRAFQTTNDNQKLVRETALLRHQRAKLLGFQNHADFVLQKRMAESTPRVQQFLQRLLKTYKAAAQKDLEQLKSFAKERDGLNEICPWDIAYYSEKLKQKLYSYDEEQLRPYFKLENVIAGAFEHARKLYGLEFRESGDYPVYHADVKVFEVWQNQGKDFVGLFYADFFPRAGKRGGAWMTNFYEQGKYFGQVMRPHVGIVCNFTKPTATKPSLLTFEEVRTLFHEFGHGLHSLLSQCQFRTISGTNVYWDFVELPSQVMENWTLEKESLDLFAKHFQTGGKIPVELTQTIKRAAQFQAGWFGLRQVTFASLDMAWHSADPSHVQNVSQFELEAIKDIVLLPPIAGTNISCSFAHIFSGGYSAGYYSYKWAEVLDADAFEFFKEKGLFNQEVASRFKELILSRGGTEHPMELYKRFRGREPDPNALFRRDGLLGV